MANEIVYGFAETPFGTIIVARTIDGICDLQFLGRNRMEVIHELASHWGVYTPTTQNDLMADTVKRVIFDEYDHPLKLDLQGTDFQKKVWSESVNPKQCALWLQLWPKIALPCSYLATELSTKTALRENIIGDVS